MTQPLEIRFASKRPADSQTVDPLARFAHFEKYYPLGDLDPAFPILSAFELSHCLSSINFN